MAGAWRGAARDGWAVLVTLVTLALLINGLPRLHRTLVTVAPPDFVADYRAAGAFRDGYNPYAPEGARRSQLNKNGETGFGHPPTTSFWALPFIGYDLVTANAVLGWLTLLTLLMELVALASMLRCPAPLSTAFLFFAYLVNCSFINYHLSVGQWSQAIGLLFFAAWWALRRRRDALAGLCLGAACTLKLFPGVMVLALVLARRFRAALVAGAFYLAVAAVMTSRFGLESWRVFLRVQPHIADNWLDNIQNQSVYGIVARLFHPACGPAGPTVRAAIALSTGIVLGVLALLVWPLRSRDRLRRAFDAAFAAFVSLSLFASQWTWEHYDVILILPLAILLAHLPGLWRRGQRVLAGQAVLVTAGMIASWRVSIHEKIALQPSVRAGDLDHHLRLHLLEVVNWLPAVGLLATLVWLVHVQAALPPAPALPPAGPPLLTPSATDPVGAAEDRAQVAG